MKIPTAHLVSTKWTVKRILCLHFYDLHWSWALRYNKGGNLNLGPFPKELPSAVPRWRIWTSLVYAFWLFFVRFWFSWLHEDSEKISTMLFSHYVFLRRQCLTVAKADLESWSSFFSFPSAEIVGMCWPLFVPHCFFWSLSFSEF